MYHPTHNAPSYRDAIDAAAEAEAAALERFHDLLGSEPPRPLIRRKLDEALAAAAMGLPKPQVFAYYPTKAVMAHLAMLDAYNAGRPHRVSTQIPASVAERRRRADRRAERAAKLRAAAAASEQFLPVAKAAALVGCGQRTLHKLVAARRVRVRVRNAGSRAYTLYRLPRRRRWVGQAAAAAALGVHPRTVAKQVAAGRLAARPFPGGTLVDVAHLVEVLSQRPTWSAPPPRRGRRAVAA